jgi:predicted transporter
MKKNAIITTIIGILIQFFGLGFMLYGVNNNEKFTWIGLGIVSLGLILIGIGIFIARIKYIQQKNEY